MTTQPKLQDLKRQALALAQALGLKCTQTASLKKHVGQGLDLRRKDAWVRLIERLNSLRGGVVVPFLLQSQAA